jgi:hypothetical protein
MIGMSICYPDWTPATDTMGWLSIDCGVWTFGGMKRRVNIFHPPGNPPPDVDAFLEAHFSTHRQHGYEVVKRPQDQAQE